MALIVPAPAAADLAAAAPPAAVDQYREQAPLGPGKPTPTAPGGGGPDPSGFGAGATAPGEAGEGARRARGRGSGRAAAVNAVADERLPLTDYEVTPLVIWVVGLLAACALMASGIALRRRFSNHP